jgi:ABC-type nickel/cobalt efflux system permease component RcnA
LERVAGSSSIIDLFSSDREAQLAYVKRLVGLGSFLLAFVLLWFLVLIVLKLKGAEVGCASGRAFSRRWDKAPSDKDDSSASYNETCIQDDVSDNEMDEKADPLHNGAQPSTDVDDYARELVAVPIADEEKDKSSCGCCSNHPRHVQRRKRRTRIAFLMTGGLSLACGGLLLTHMYRPLEETTETTSQVIGEGQLIIYRMQQVLRVVREAVNVADRMMEQIPLEVSVLCPNVPPSEFITELGVNPQDVVLFLTQEYESFLGPVRDNMDSVEDVASEMYEALADAQTAVAETEERLWVFLVLVISTMGLALISILGVGVAMHLSTSPEHGVRSSSWTEGILAWIILPLLVLSTVLGWALVVSLCFGTVLTTDVCMAGRSETPDATIEAILRASQLDPHGTTFGLITAYTGVSQRENVILRYALVLM